MVEIVVRCPECYRKGKIEVESNIVSKSLRGVTAINVAEFFICDHSFIAYIDKNLAVRDCIITDFQLDLPQVVLPEESNEDIPGTDLIDIYLLTINILPQTLAFIIRSCFYKKPILYINDFENVNSHLVNFFEFIFGDNFEVNIFLTTNIGYKKHKKQFKNHIVIKDNEVINDKDKIMNFKKMKIENALVQKFYFESDSKSSLIIIRNDIKRAYEFAQAIVEFNNTLKENETLSSKRVIDYIFKRYNINLPLPYLRLLMDVAENNFGVQLKRDDKAADFMGLFSSK